MSECAKNTILSISVILYDLGIFPDGVNGLIVEYQKPKSGTYLGHIINKQQHYKPRMVIVDSDKSKRDSESIEQFIYILSTDDVLGTRNNIIQVYAKSDFSFVRSWELPGKSKYSSLGIDNKHLYVYDGRLKTITVYHKNGQLVKTISTNIHDGYNICVDEEFIYLTNWLNHTLWKINKHDETKKVFASNPNTSGCGEIAVDREYIYSVETFSHQIRIFDKHGNIVRIVEGFTYPEKITVDTQHVYMSEANDCYVKIFSKFDGKFLGTIGKKGYGEGEMAEMYSFAVDDNYLYAIDANGIFVFIK